MNIAAPEGEAGRGVGGLIGSGKEGAMVTQARTLGWTAWIVIFVVALLTVIAGLLYVAQ